MKGKDELRQELIAGNKMLSEIFEGASKEDYIDLFIESLEACGGCYDKDPRLRTLTALLSMALDDCCDDNNTDDSDDEDFYFLPLISDDV